MLAATAPTRLVLADGASGAAVGVAQERGVSKMELALIAGGWTEDRPFCWLPTKHGYLCFEEPEVVPTLEEAQDAIRHHEETRGKPDTVRAMTAARRALDNPVEVVLESGVRRQIC